MVFFEAVQALLTFNFSVFLDIVANNFLWLFLFYCAAHFFVSEKRAFYPTLFLSIYLWIFLDFLNWTGFEGFAASPLIFFIVFALLIIVVDNMPVFKKRQSEVHIVVIYGLLLYFTFFL